MGGGCSTKAKPGADQPDHLDASHEPGKDGAINKSNFVVVNKGKIQDMYHIDKKMLGQGSYGNVSKCENKKTGRMAAVKVLKKSDNKSDRTKQEVGVMKSMDHPNIVKLYETFEDAQQIYLVMELCGGGELFDRIIHMQHFTEVQAAHVMQHLFRSIYYLHEQKVTHRDLKPENFLFTDDVKLEEASLKLIDFGLACKFEPGQNLTTKAGTPYYVAPQVLTGKYDHTADNWSSGVIMYVMLCGYPPFMAQADKEILAMVKKGKFEFPAKDWKQVSKDAKDLICGLMKMSPKERTTAHDALEHTWTKNKAPNASDAPIHAGLVDNLKSFRSTNKLKKAALNVIATQLDDKAIKALKDVFQALDSDGDGHLTAAELREGISKAGIENIPPELEEIMQQVDVDGSGSIDYSEFLAATLDRRIYMEESVCWSAFRVFDKDGNGRISKDEIANVLGDGDVKNMAVRDLAELMKEIDQNGDGEIDFDEFMAMMRK